MTWPNTPSWKNKTTPTDFKKVAELTLSIIKATPYDARTSNASTPKKCEELSARRNNDENTTRTKRLLSALGADDPKNVHINKVEDNSVDITYYYPDSRFLGLHVVLDKSMCCLRIITDGLDTWLNVDIPFAWFLNSVEMNNLIAQI